MEYKFKTIRVDNEPRERIYQNSLDELNNYYDNGWEYVNSTAQVMAYCADEYYAPVLFTIKKLI